MWLRRSTPVTATETINRGHRNHKFSATKCHEFHLAGRRVPSHTWADRRGEATLGRDRGDIRTQGQAWTGTWQDEQMWGFGNSSGATAGAGQGDGAQEGRSRAHREL